MERQRRDRSEETDLPLDKKWRPKDFNEVIGQDHVVKSLQSVLQSKNVPHSYLFSGIRGAGKTTLARIIAKYVNCLDRNILEIDAATYTGIDDMRQLQDGLRYGAVGESSVKLVIIDECHSLSRKAWDSLLKIIEDAPKHVFFVFCTTELSKVPQTIKSRCHDYNLREVKLDDLLDLVDFICKKERIDLPEGVDYLIAKESYGSPREVIVNLSKCRYCKTKQEVIEILETAEESSEVIELCRLLTSNKSTWADAVKILRTLKEKNPESVRIVICTWLNSCILRARSDKEAAYFLGVLDLFSKPIYQATGMTDILLSVGDVYFRN